MTYDPQVGDKVLTINTILRNALHVDLILVGKTNEELQQASGQILEQIMHWLGETGYGVVTDTDPQTFGIDIQEVNNPKTNTNLTLIIPENIRCVTNSIEFIGSLD